MMPPLSTPVAAEALPLRLDMPDGIVSLGSCFADEVSARLADGGFRVERNPFGTLYNPASVASALWRIIDCREVAQSDLVQSDGLWHSWHHHGSFSRPTAQECLDACNASLHRAHRALAEARLLLLTFGTAWVFEHDGAVVANCHKLPQSCFVRRRLSVADVVGLWQPLLPALRAFNPSLRVVFTVSPIRHLADGAHGNQLSKATLLLAVSSLVGSDPDGLFYFPAYEIVLDELRDYRFYAPDMVHPSPLAADIVLDRFEQVTMTPAVRQQAHNNRKRAKRDKHIPLHTS